MVWLPKGCVSQHSHRSACNKPHLEQLRTFFVGGLELAGEPAGVKVAESVVEQVGEWVCYD